MSIKIRKLLTVLCTSWIIVATIIGAPMVQKPGMALNMVSSKKDQTKKYVISAKTKIMI